MPTLKIEDILKDPENVKVKKINRNSKAEKKRIKEVQDYISGSRERQKVDWEKLRNIRFK